MASKIEWTDKTWNPVHGCTPVSPACDNCYAQMMAKRLSGIQRTTYDPDDPFKVVLVPEKLDEPRHWSRPSMVFVPSMGDLFHKDVPDSFLDDVFAVMSECRRHTFQVLTKRPERMRDYVCSAWSDLADTNAHIWLGVTAENQEWYDNRVPLLMQTPAAIRFISVEPILGPVHVSHPLDWVITGAEYHYRNPRPMNWESVRDLRDNCQERGIRFFFKQCVERAEGGLGGWRKVTLPELDGKVWDQIPERTTV